MSDKENLEEVREEVKKLSKSVERFTKLLRRNEGLLRLFLWTMTFWALIWIILGAIRLYATFLMMTRTAPMTYADALTSAIALSLLIAILVIIWAILAIKNTTYSTRNNGDNEEEESE